MRGDGRIYQRGAIWWVEYWHRGDQVRESSKGFVCREGKPPSDGTDRRAAEKLLQARRRTAGTSHFIGPDAERVDFKVFAELYLTDYRINGRRSVGEAERAVRHLRGTFGLDRAVDITAARIGAYTAARLAEGHKPATINRELAALRRMFTLAMRAEMLPHRPHIAMLDESGNVREGFLEPADFEAVCTATNKHGQTILPSDVQDVLRFAYLTGWRRGAVCSLEWRDVDLRARTLRLRAANAKNKRGKLLPLRADLLALLERRAELRRPDCIYVFHRNGKRLVDFRKAWKAACKAAGFSGPVPHDLRRSAARNAVRSGVPEQVAMELGGWRTRSVFARYNVTSEADLAAAIERISGYVAERATEAPKVRPLRTEPAQNPHNPAADDTPARRAGGLSS